MLQKYHVILAVGAFVIKNNKLLIVKKSPLERVDPGLWTIPGGKIEPNEPIVIGLKREVLEEVGLRINSFKWIGEDVFESNSFYFHAQHFLCYPLHSNIRLEKNLVDFHWMEKKEINNFQFPVNIKKRIKEIFDYKHE
ncbi:MAG: NUDIX hydrolase [Candidatus Roizmanbacteria bacterium GW2011_GWC2_37_13]|uniref:8-oxo-dGTP diphosphatase n=1 Tax=Candidatus Roizmanbacteria bacterium GW2011_GWC2_37_13 TaxID=1618486 RepID=A0A0G0IMI0_9BACT|nr:MAG: NUDIX hydrolase [Candidatus Roizmanbacteria bacterium GW2011_GWC1_37_12]KKQ25424.1 MAG: NUDIX hydrolase [Candidatus Roizmanbacteria bacterium GW2011_GWC2_37_13]